MDPLSAIRNQTIGCYSVMTGLFLLLTDLQPTLERQSNSQFDIARIVRPVGVAKERRCHDAAVVLVLWMVERVPGIHNERDVRA